MDTKILGNFGEDLAVRYLKAKGYEILGRNFQRKVSNFLKSEIDIIAKPRRNVLDILRGKKDNIIHFIEVKTLKNTESFYPEEKVDFRKKQKIIKTAQTWLLKNKIPLDSQWQIDIVAIMIESEFKKARIRLFENI